MNENSGVINFLRQFFAVLLGAVCVAVGLGLCYWMIVSGGVFGLIGVSVMPVVVGLAAGIMMRLVCAEGTFSLASVGIVMVLVFGLACAAMRHKLLFDARLKQDAAAAYEETLAYAKNIVPAEADDAALRRYMISNEVSVIGRLTPVESEEQRHNYWETRNFIHLHWIAAHHIILHGQHDVDSTISKASSVLGDTIFLDKIVTSISESQPVTDDSLRIFRQYELPSLKKMVSGEITADAFEQPLIKDVASRVDWQTFAINGFETFLGLAMIMGSAILYKLVRQSADDEIV